jgi:mRNA interferase MazF
VLCALTSNLQRAESPGNVLFKKGEANLPKASVINITQLITVAKSEIKEKISSLSKKRGGEVIEGLKMLMEPREID